MTDAFPPNSRYYQMPIRTHVTPDGTVESFVGRRIIPALERYRVLDRYRTRSKSRIDTVADEVFGDPELYWRLCDANGDAEPATAAQPEARLLIVPLPLEIADNGKS